MKNRFVKKISCVLAAVLLTASLAACEKSDAQKDKLAYRTYGIKCIQNGDYDEAVEAFDKALAMEVTRVGDFELDVCYYKAKAQYLNGNVDEAIETYSAIIDYNGDGDAYYLRGCLYFAQNDPDGGIADFKKAVKKNKNDLELYIGIYETMAKYGLEQDGQEYLNTALEIDGDDADTLMQKGRIYTLLADYDNAVEMLKKAIEKENTKANYYLGQTYSKMGDAENAQAYFQAYLDSGEADSYDLMNMGQAQMDDGHYDTAITYFSAALELESVPNKQQIWKNLIVSYEYSKDFESAKTQMEQYLDEYPDDEDASKEYQFLETR